jgi:hypothetical protein
MYCRARAQVQVQVQPAPARAQTANENTPSCCLRDASLRAQLRLAWGRGCRALGAGHDPNAICKTCVKRVVRELGSVGVQGSFCSVPAVDLHPSRVSSRCFRLPFFLFLFPSLFPRVVRACWGLVGWGSKLVALQRRHHVITDAKQGTRILHTARSRLA